MQLRNGNRRSGVVESQFNPDLKRIHNSADLVTPDGMPLVWLNWYYGRRLATRVYGPDLLLPCVQTFPSLRITDTFSTGLVRRFALD